LSWQQIPGWWIWYYWFCPLAWSVYALIAAQFGDVTTNVMVVGSQKTYIVKDYLEQQFGFRHSFLPVVGPMLLVWMVFFAGIFIFAIKFLNFQKR